MSSKMYYVFVIILFANTIPMMAREINNLLVNDLNIIASKLDDIPFTNLNVQLVLLAYNCRDLLITWNVGAAETTVMKSFVSQPTTNNGHYYTLGSGGGITSGTSTESPSSHSKPFGFQIVVREYLNIQDNNEDDNKPPRNINKTMRLYTSKYIDVNAKQNKFKLRNLLFNNVATYDICLVIYFDVVETVAFEKQCVQFNLPYTLYKNNKLCNKTDADEGLMLPTIKPKHKSASTIESKVHTIDYEDENVKITTKPSTTTHGQNQFETTEYIPFSTAITNLTELCSQYISPKALQECSQYPNLIIAFVVCIIFLATNLFMFTIIVLNVVMKHVMMRKRRKQLQSTTNETIVDENKKQINNNNNNNNNNKSVKSESRTKTPSTMISESRSNITSPTKRHSTTTPYHQKNNICCMYDRCYKTDLTSFSKNSLHSRSRIVEKQRSRSLGNKILSCLCGIACPDCENSTSKCHQHMKYNEINQINTKYKISPNPNEFARAGYILNVPNPILNQPDFGLYSGKPPSPPVTPSSITTGSTMSSFDRIRKMRKLNNWFSLKRKQQEQQQQQINRFNIDHHQIPVQQLTAQQTTHQQLNNLLQQSQMNKFNQLNQLNYFNQQQPPQFNTQFRRSMFNSTYSTDQDGISMYDDDDESFDSEIFYHYPPPPPPQGKQLGQQMSSAF